METLEKNNLINLIQLYATGKVTNGFNPQALAEAISQKVAFNQPINVFSANKNHEVIRNLSKGISALKKEMEAELKNLDKEEKLLANFIRGKITAYQELKDLLK